MSLFRNLPVLADPSTPQWKIASQREYARILTGRFAHYCPEQDGKPLDETIAGRWPCACADALAIEREQKSGPA